MSIKENEPPLSQQPERRPPERAEPSPRSWGSPYNRLMEAEATLRSLLPHTQKNTTTHSTLRRALDSLSDVGEFLLREEARAQQIQEAQGQEGNALPLADGRWLISVKEASRLIGINPSTVYSRYVYGEWHRFVITVGRRKLVRVDKLREWLDQVTKEQHPEVEPSLHRHYRDPYRK